MLFAPTAREQEGAKARPTLGEPGASGLEVGPGGGLANLLCGEGPAHDIKLFIF